MLSHDFNAFLTEERSRIKVLKPMYSNYRLISYLLFLSVRKPLLSLDMVTIWEKGNKIRKRHIQFPQQNTCTKNTISTELIIVYLLVVFSSKEDVEKSFLQKDFAQEDLKWDPNHSYIIVCCFFLKFQSKLNRFLHQIYIWGNFSLFLTFKNLFQDKVISLSRPTSVLAQISYNKHIYNWLSFWEKGIKNDLYVKVCPVWIFVFR